MASVSITRKFLNNAKRTVEAGVATLPAVLGVSGDRSSRVEDKVLTGNTYTALCIPERAVIQAVYLNITEAFDAGTTLTAVLNSDDTALFTTVDATVVGLTKSTAEDILTTVKDGAKFSVNQNVTQGNAEVIFVYAALDNKNGNYV
jgi:hypothetical protein